MPNNHEAGAFSNWHTSGWALGHLEFKHPIDTLVPPNASSLTFTIQLSNSTHD